MTLLRALLEDFLDMIFDYVKPIWDRNELRVPMTVVDDTQWANQTALEEDGSLVGVGPKYPDLSFVPPMFIHQIRMRKRLGVAVEDLFAQIHNLHQTYYDGLVKNGASVERIPKRLNIPNAWDEFWNRK